MQPPDEQAPVTPEGHAAAPPVGPKAATPNAPGAAGLPWWVFAVAVVPWAAFVWRYFFVVDDAFITYRFSRNLARGHGPRYNLGDGAPVEGYSDFLWMLLAAVPEAAGASPWLVMPWVSAALGLVTLLGVIVTLGRLGAAPMAVATSGLFLATFPPFTVWATSGLETMPLTGLLLATWALLALGDDRRDATLGGLAGLGLALIRTEGVAWLGLVALVAAAQRALAGRPVLGPARRAIVVFAPAFAAWFAWKVSYYGDLVANTAHAKVHLSPAVLVRGLEYLALYLLTLPGPLLLAGVLAAGWPRASLRGSGPRAERARAAAGVATLAAAIHAYAVVVSGDYMAWFRLMAPASPFLALAFGLGLHGLIARGRGRLLPALAVAVIATGALPALDLPLTPPAWRAAFNVRDKLGVFRSENEQWASMRSNVVEWRAKGEALAAYARPDDTFVAAAIGAVGYFSDLYVYDRNGLVNREVAREPWNGTLRSPGHDKVVDRAYFLPQKPTILDAKLIWGPHLAATAERALTHMEARSVRRHYFPELFKVPGRRRWMLVALRRAESPAAAREGWAVYERRAERLKRGR